MELRHLRYFLAVAETRSFTRAAEKMRVTQPTLSHQIKQLEARVGTVLFVRGPRDVELTAAGQAFKPHCERVLKEVETGLLAMSELEGLMRGTLRMAVFHSFSSSMLPPVLSEFARRYPGVRVVARLVPRDELDRDLMSDALDLAIAYASSDDEHIVTERLFTESLVLVVGSQHPRAGAHSLKMRELADLPLVLLTPEFGARQFVDRYFMELRLQPHIVIEMNAIEPILSIIRNSSLATVLSAGAVGDPSGLHVIPLTDPVPTRVAAILWRRHGHRSAAARRMAEMIKVAYASPARPAVADRVPPAGRRAPKA